MDIEIPLGKRTKNIVFLRCFLLLGYGAIVLLIVLSIVSPVLHQFIC